MCHRLSNPTTLPENNLLTSSIIERIEWLSSVNLLRKKEQVAIHKLLKYYNELEKLYHFI